MKTYSDYTERFPYVYGKKIGILVDKTTNKPIQEIEPIKTNTNLDIADVGSLQLKAYLRPNEYIEGTGTGLVDLVDVDRKSVV